MANLSNINNKFLVTTGGNVLIGQTSAVGSSIFQVTGSVNITGGTTSGLNITTSGTQDTININRAANNDNAITKYQTASADKWIVGLRNTGDDNFRFYSYGTSTDVLTINQGNGSATFAGMITVNGGGIDIDNNDDVRLRFDNAGTFLAGLQVATTAGDMISSTAINDFAVRSQANLIFSSGGNTERMRIGQTHGDKTFISSYSGGTFPLRVGYGTFASFTPTFVIDDAGNVGIGTDSPNAPLQIASTNKTINGSLSGSNLSVYTTDTQAANVGASIGLGGMSTTPAGFEFYGTMAGRKENSTNLDSSGYLAFYTQRVAVGHVERMRIDSSGNVGIKNTNPSAFNSLGGGGLVIGDGTQTNNLTLFSAATGGGVGYGHIAFADSNTSSSSAQYAGLIQYYHGNDSMQFYTDATPRLTILNSGNVGIGTTSPDYQLDIENTSGAAVMRLHAAANNSASLRLKNDAVDWDVNCQTNDTFAIYNHTDGTERLVILPTSGNVGIGVTGPSKKLEVAGSYKLGTNAYIQYDAGYPYTINMLNTAAVGNLILNAGAGSSGFESKIELQGSNTVGAAGITLSTGSTTKMQITVNGSTILYPSAGSKGLSMNDTNQVMNSGYINGNQAISLTFTCTTMSSMFIECVFNHYGYITSYGCSRVATFAVGPVIQINNIQEITTGNGGSWTFNRVSNGEFTVVKTAGTYGGGGRWYVKINGANVYAS